MSSGAAGSLSREVFVRRYGGIYEHSPWVAERAWEEGAASLVGDVDALHARLKEIVEGASLSEKLTLLRAHPDLAKRASLTVHSQAEQASAGLDACSPEEADAFGSLNAAYEARFDFPFILAVKGLHRQDILAVFRKRLANSPDEEFATAMAEVHKIARLRLRDLS